MAFNNHQTAAFVIFKFIQGDFLVLPNYVYVMYAMNEMISKKFQRKPLIPNKHHLKDQQTVIIF